MVKDDDVYDFSNQDFLDDEEDIYGGGGFLEAKREAWVPRQPKIQKDVGAAAPVEEDAFRKLNERAEAAREAQVAEADKQKKTIQPRFGGGRAAREVGALGTKDNMDDLKMEFLHELQADAPKKFVSPDEEQDDDSDEEEVGERQKAQFTTDEVWEDIEYDNRKNKVVEELDDATSKFAKAKVDLPRLKVDNTRLEREREQLQKDIEKLQKQEQKLLQRYPELAKQRDKKEQEVARSTAAKTAKELKERQRQEEKIRMRHMKRRQYIEKTIELMEEQNKDFGEVFAVASSNIGSRARAVTMSARLKWMRLVLQYDPMTHAIDGVTLQMPRATAYFKTLRWQLIANAAWLLVTIPQVLAWVYASQVRLASDSILMPNNVLYSSVPRTLVGLDMSRLYGLCFVAAFLLYGYTCLSRLFADARKYMVADVYQLAQATDKFSKVVFNAMNLGVQSRAEAQLSARQAVAKLSSLLAQKKDQERDEKREQAQEHHEASTTPQHTVWAKRAAGGVANLGLVTAPWVLVELLVDADTLEYPTGYGRLIAPAAAAAFNCWLIPLLTPWIVRHGEFSKEASGRQILVRTLLARLANVVVILRRSFLTLTAASRVWKPALARDTCYCEDEVGVTLFYYWAFDWAASTFKLLAVPTFYLTRAAMAESKGRGAARRRRGQERGLREWWAGWVRPELDIASAVVDQTAGQLLLLLTIPLLPVTVFFGLLAHSYGFGLQRLVLVNLWGSPTRVQYAPLAVRAAHSLVTCLGLVVAAVAYAYLWLALSTEALPAPVCQLPVLFVNASSAAVCRLDPETGAPAELSCAPFRDTACAGRAAGPDDLVLYHSQTPAGVMGGGLAEVVDLVGSAPLGWGIVVLLGVRAGIQRNYRARFQAYVEEKRYVLLLHVANLEKTLKKQDRILAIQWNE